MAQQLVLNMDDNLYKAARAKGAPIAPQINFLSRTLGDRNSALHVAAQYGNLIFIEQVLKEDSTHYYHHLCQQNFKGETPLHQAAQFGYLKIVEFLLEAHFNEPPNVDPAPRDICWMVRDNQGDTPLHKAIIHGHDHILVALLNRERLFDPRVAGNDILYKNMVTTVNNRGRTIFHYAVEENKHQLVEENKHQLVMNLLRDDRSLAYMRDNDGLTPLHIAFKHGLYQMVENILDMSPQSIEIRDNHGKSPLHYAKMDRVFLEKCRTSIDESIFHLLINMVDDDGNTALHVALINSEENVAHQLLLFKGCNRRLRNKHGDIPWDLCQSNKNTPHVYIELRQDWAPQKSSHSNMLFLEDEKEVENCLDKIAIAAALLLPLNFSAAFIVPGGYDNIKGGPVYWSHHTFHVYSLSNMIAFLATVFILISCTFGIGKRVKKRQLARANILLLQVALFFTIIAYAAGIFVIGDIGRDYKVRLPVILLSIGTVIVGSLFVINWVT